MSDPAVLFAKPKAISRADKKALAGAGIIVVEVEDPASVKLVRAGYELSHGDMLSCAGQAILNQSTCNGNARELFGKAVAAALAVGKQP